MGIDSWVGKINISFPLLILFFLLQYLTNHTGTSKRFNHTISFVIYHLFHDLSCSSLETCHSLVFRFVFFANCLALRRSRPRRMSTFRNALPSTQTPTPQPDLKSPEHHSFCNSTASDGLDESQRPKTFASAVGKLLRTAIKKPRNVLAKHLNGKKHFQKLMPRRKKKVATSPEVLAGSPEEVNAADDIPAANPADASPATNPATATRDEPGPEPLSPPEPRFAATEPTESSISLCSQSEATPTASHTPHLHHPQNIITYVDHQFRPGRRCSTPLSEASTLQNSTYVNDNLSRRASESQPPPAPESDPVPSVATPPSTPLPPLPSQPGRPYAPRIQTNLGHLYVPGSDEENSHSTVRDRSSSPASAVDFHGMGGHFEESSSQRGRSA
jgi:hypothetical protein